MTAKFFFFNRKEREGRKDISAPLRPLRPLRLKKAPFPDCIGTSRGLGVVLLLAVLSGGGCSPTVEQHLAASAAREASSRHERDSVVYVIRDSTVVRHQRDTVVIERIRDRWRDRLVTRTDTVLRTDTLRSAIVQRVEVPAPRSWWARFVAGVGYAALVAGAVYIVIKIKTPNP